VTQVERAGLEALKRAVGRRHADRISYLYRDRVQPTIEAITYNASTAGRRSRRRLQRLRDQYRGQRCFIIGNGPSLNDMDLSPLRNEVTFGLNRGYLLADRIGAPTTFLVAVNRYVVEQFSSDLLGSGSTTFVSWRSRRYLPSGSDVIFVRRSRLFTFSPNPATHGAWEGATVTYVAMQLAFHLGFSIVVLIGVDHSFASKGPANKLVTATTEDLNHFDPGYFGPGVEWQLPDLEVSEAAYRIARQQFASAGRTILDATVRGQLAVFPKVEFEDLMRFPTHQAR